MAFSGAANFIHSDVTIFGNSAAFIYRHPTTGKVTLLNFGVADANKVLSFDATGNPILAPQATFSLTDDSVTNAKLANVNSGTIKGRVSAGAGDPEDLTVAQLQALLTLGIAAYRSVGIASGNLVEVLAGGTIDPALIPAVRSHEFVQVADQTARLALTATQVQPGDEAYETTTGRTFKLIATPPSTVGNWVLISDVTIDGADIVSGLIAPDRLGTNGAAGRFLSYSSGWQTIQGKDPLSVVTANGALSHNTRVYANGATRLVLSLPTTFVQGAQIQVTDIGGNGWRISQAAGQQIILPTGETSTLGATGYVESSLGDGITTPRSPRCQVMLENITSNTWLVAQQNSVITYV